MTTENEEAKTRRKNSQREWARREQRDHPEKPAARKRRYRLKHPEKVKAQQRARYAALSAEAKWARYLKQSHKMTPDEFEAAWSVQGGCCYLCKDKLERGLAYIEHDHHCCPPRKSCGACRRGLSCPRCNFIVGHAFDDPGRLHRIADNLEVAITGRPGKPGGGTSLWICKRSS